MASCAAAGLYGMVESEYAFAQQARTSVRGAFLAYLAEDSVVLAPGPVAGRSAYTAAKDFTGLDWYPAEADIAVSGDLGFTTGPWSLASGASIAHGHFLTVWRFESACRWRVALDGGISNAAPASAEPKLEPAPPDASAESEARHDATIQQGPEAGLLKTDPIAQSIHDFEDAARQAGLDAGLRAYARNDGFLLLIEGAAPMRLGAAEPYFEKHPHAGEWQQKASGRSADSTLSYCAGETTSDGHDRSAYVQIWQYDPKVANWGLRVLLISPLVSK